MTNDLTDAQNRLVSLRQLHQVAALLNMPYPGETVTHDDSPQSRQQAALYAGIADWARLSAQAAEQLGKSNIPEITDKFAYLVEYTDRHAKGWHQAPSEQSHGITLGTTAETVAQIVLPRYITHLAEHRYEYELWLVDTLSLRASVWHVDSTEARPRRRRPNFPSSPLTLKEAEVPPQAVEIRTPTQIYRLIDHQLAL
ncbi:hypothetical protein GCM10022224_008530 [Nonomuraea antimicrobica]|uniref:Uncharacterized protein n=1 Tax=Nonomuraea antimicrobica TaxID=561173 RepID=A0ABP7B3G3_9ACTN